jgi:hypothetical protein
MAAGGLGLSARGWTAKPIATDDVPIHQVSQEVTALLILRDLKVTSAQVKALRKIAKETTARPKADAETKVSDAFRKLLTKLHKALVDKVDDKRIDELMEQLDDLRVAEKPELGDEVETTAAAVEQAPQVLRMFSARQIAGFIASHAEEVVDPTERLLEALDQVRGLPEERYKEFREELAGEVSGLIAGLDDDKAAKVHSQVVQWLVIIRSLKDDEFKAQHADLEKKAKEIVGDVGATDVLRHFLEQTMVELLSNPRLSEALEARK